MEINNPQSVNEVTESIIGNDFFDSIVFQDFETDRYNQQRNRKVCWIDNFDGTQTGVAISSCKEGSGP